MNQFAIGENSAWAQIASPACSYLEAQGFDVTNFEGGMLAYDGELEFK